MTPTRVSLVVLLAVVAVFGQTLWAGFVWDDVLLLEFNTQLREPGAALRALTLDFWDTSVPTNAIRGYWRPLLKVSHVLLSRLGGGAPWPFHLFNLLLHATASLLVTVWVRLRLRASFTPEAIEPAALVAGLVFALHPSRYESVGWASCSTDLVFACLALTAAVGFERRTRWGWVAVLGAAFSKETAVTLPLLFAADAWVRGELRARAGWLLGALVAVTPPLALRRFVGIVFPDPMVSVSLSAVVERVLGAVAGYHQRTLFPTQVTMLPWETAQPEPGRFDVPAVVLVGGALCLAAWVVFAVSAWRRPAVRPYLADALWWLLPIAPLLQVIPVPSPALLSDRFLYLPMAGVAAVLARGVAALAVRPERRRPVLLALGGLGVAAAALLSLALPAYRSNAAYFEREFSLHPGHPFVAECYARALSGAGQFYAAQHVYLTMLERPLPAHTRAMVVALLAATFEHTLRDSQARELSQLAAFFNAAAARAPVDLVIGERRWPLPPGERRFDIFTSPDADAYQEARMLLLARLGQPDLLLRRCAVTRRDRPSAQATLKLATELALAGRFVETEAVLLEDREKFPALKTAPMTGALLDIARLKLEPPLDGFNFALRRARFFGRFGSPRRARLELAPFVEEHRLETRLVDARVQVELDDKDFAVALALLDEVLAARPDDVELRGARQEVEREQQRFEAAVELELSLADPAGL